MGGSHPEMGNALAAMSDLKGWESQAIEPYAIGSIPHLILIDQNGTIVARNIKAKTLYIELGKLLK